MSYPDDDFPPKFGKPVPVNVQNLEKRRVPDSTMIRTYLFAALAANGRVVEQVAAQEPNRTRLAIVVVDAPVLVCAEQPTTTPDASSATALPSSIGGVFPIGTFEFTSTAPLWVVSLGTNTRVTVIKEYASGA